MMLVRTSGVGHKDKLLVNLEISISKIHTYRSYLFQSAYHLGTSSTTCPFMPSEDSSFFVKSGWRGNESLWVNSGHLLVFFTLQTRDSDTIIAWTSTEVLSQAKSQFHPLTPLFNTSIAMSQIP